ncbi:PIG-L deacetylase family protein [Rhodococcus sp. MSC1_016]|jgi:4-oxalomesaconate hydratase|uniref:PIG-L deacetylase family protein n=1 Tax=Rhodococcus sp. MSC1_016 TaxID=2909266 RepID=UPI00202E5694|nr:PIG-L deacetylase family protein [Rhodococcus sp. MSC1_016]
MTKVTVVSAHGMDWVWRTGGTILKYVQAGADVTVVCLSMGERGESASAWAEPGQTAEKVRALRLGEAEKAAAVAGVELRTYDWGDYPMVIDDDRRLEMVRLLRELRPDVVLTHGRRDPNNPDHVATADLVEAAAIWSRAHGRLPELPRFVVGQIHGYEPEFPEFCDFKPDTYIDISDVAEQKLEMMRCSQVQEFMIDVYEQRARYRAIMAGLLLGRQVTHAEAFESFLPAAGDLFR